MTEAKKPTPRKKPSKPKSAEVVAPKVDVEAEKKVEEKPKTEVVKQPDPKPAEAKLIPPPGHPPVDPGPEPTVTESLDSVGVVQTLYGGGRLKKRLRTRRTRFE